MKRAEPEAPRLFSDVMQDWDMAAPAALTRSIDAGGSASSSGASGAAAADLSRDTVGSPDEMLRAAEQLLDHVLTGACESRDSALDLLTVDALVTRAMAIAARDSKLLAEFPESAMKRLSAR